jgi:DNA-binding CsgD family transcriptional regulator
MAGHTPACSFMFVRNDIVLAVREMLDRHFTPSDIAAKLNISIELVYKALEIIQDLLT